MKKIIMLFVLGCYQVAFGHNTGGGTVVGNGAGIVESSFQHAYYSLSNIIASCTASRRCETTREENLILQTVTSIVKMNANKKDRLVFLSEKLNPGFFTTGSDQKNRIAKTFLNPESPIYINTDMLYSESGAPALNTQGIIRILVHELGHQTGFTDHALLDILGVKVSVFSEDRTNHYSLRSQDDNNIQFDVTNLEHPVKTSILIFNWKNKKVQDLSNTIIASTSCSYDSESYQGIELVNGHFDFDNMGMLKFQAWINLYCFEAFSAQIYIYRKNLIINLDQDYQILGLKVK